MLNLRFTKPHFIHTALLLSKDASLCSFILGGIIERHAFVNIRTLLLGEENRYSVPNGESFL